MALTYPTLTFPCSVNSVPFYPATSMRRPSDAMINFGQSAYIDSLLQWQSFLPYENKRLFTDTITLQFKTQNNSTVYNDTPTTFNYVNPAKLYVCKSVAGPNGVPIPGAIVAGFTSVLNAPGTLFANRYNLVAGSQFWGMQQPAYDIYTDPITASTVPLTTYMYSFTFGDVLSATTDSGVYFLRFDNVDVDGGIFTEYSEPILVYGTDAKVAFPNTLYFEATNRVNKNDIIIDNWFNHPSDTAVFTNRVEAYILEYEPKGIYMGFLQQSYEPLTTFNKSWKVWSLNIGGVDIGVPATEFEIITKIMEMDLILINNQYYNYDIQTGGSQNPAAAWKMDKTRYKGLFTGTLPIRYRFENQFYVGSPIAMPHIFDGTFGGPFS